MNKGSFSGTALILFLFFSAAALAGLAMAGQQSARDIRFINRLSAEKEILTAFGELRTLLAEDPTPGSRWKGDPFEIRFPNGEGILSGCRFTVTEHGGRLWLKGTSRQIFGMPALSPLFAGGSPALFLAARDSACPTATPADFRDYLDPDRGNRWLTGNGILSVNTSDPLLLQAVFQTRTDPGAIHGERIYAECQRNNRPVPREDWPISLAPGFSADPPLNVHFADRELLIRLAEGFLEKPGDTGDRLYRESRSRELSSQALAALVPDDPGRERFLALVGTRSPLWTITVQKKGLVWQAALLLPENTLTVGRFL